MEAQGHLGCQYQQHARLTAWRTDVLRVEVFSAALRGGLHRVRHVTHGARLTPALFSACQAEQVRARRGDQARAEGERTAPRKVLFGRCAAVKVRFRPEF